MCGSEERTQTGSQGQPLSIASEGAFEPLVVSSVGLIEERTERDIKWWTKGIGKTGGGQLVARMSLMLQKFRGLHFFKVGGSGVLVSVSS